MDIKKILDDIKKEIKQTLLTMNYADSDFSVELEVPGNKEHGDYSTNSALKVSKNAKKNPRIIAEEIISLLKNTELPIEKYEVAGPGFINMFLSKSIYFETLTEVLSKGTQYGTSSIGKGTRILLEYVSANPTGYLHIGHARGGAYGDSLANILEKAGYDVGREFYVNDAGNQMNNLGQSIKARYMQELGMEVEMPEDGYFGKEIVDIAKKLFVDCGKDMIEESIDFFKDFGLKHLLKGLEDHLTEYRIEFDKWFSERNLYDGDVQDTIKLLKSNGHLYQREGATWMKTSEFFDEKDRVAIKSDGNYTYIVPDIAYHKNKFDRGYDILINVLGADHHGYMDRLKSTMAMIGKNPDGLEFQILQMVRVYQDGKEIKMSKRSGKAIGLMDLIDEVGVDPIRYFFAARALSSPMDLDLDLALRKTNENPVYYAQYAHARISSIIRQYDNDITPLTSYNRLNDNSLELLNILSQYKLVIEECAIKRIPHKLTNYIQTLAGAFHSYYNKEKILSEDKEETIEKLNLICAVQIVLKDALTLIGVDSPEKM